MIEITIRFDGTGRTHGAGRTSVAALHPTDLQVSSGELLAAMGPSGSGKTTLLSLAGGLDMPTHGRVLVHDKDLAGLSTRQLAALRRRSIGYVFQDLNLLPGLTALENVMLPRELDGVNLRQARSEGMAALERVGMTDLAHRFPEDLSGGEAQRVAIARAIVGPRTILLADEPTGALDTVTGESVMRLLRDHCETGGTGVIVTHDAAHAAWADRVVFLRDGRITDQSGPLPGPEVLGAGSQMAP